MVREKDGAPVVIDFGHAVYFHENGKAKFITTKSPYFTHIVGTEFIDDRGRTRLRNVKYESAIDQPTVLPGEIIRRYGIYPHINSGQHEDLARLLKGVEEQDENCV